MGWGEIENFAKGVDERSRVFKIEYICVQNNSWPTYNIILLVI